MRVEEISEAAASHTSQGKEQQRAAFIQTISFTLD
jgi:hypothetical protein